MLLYSVFLLHQNFLTLEADRVGESTKQNCHLFFLRERSVVVIRNTYRKYVVYKIIGLKGFSELSTFLLPKCLYDTNLNGLFLTFQQSQ